MKVPDTWNAPLYVARLVEEVRGHEVALSANIREQEFVAFRGLLMASMSLRSAAPLEALRRWPTFEVAIAPENWEGAATGEFGFYYHFPVPAIGIVRAVYEPPGGFLIGRPSFRVWPQYVETTSRHNLELKLARALRPEELPPLGWKLAIHEALGKLAPSNRQIATATARLHETINRASAPEIKAFYQRIAMGELESATPSAP